MRVGMIIKEAGYCTGKITINEDNPISMHLDEDNYLCVSDFWISKHHLLRSTATIHTDDIVAIWKTK